MRLDENLMKEVADVIRLLYSRGLTQLRGGNASAIDRQAGLVYITPTGVPRHLIKEDDVAVVSLDGNVVVGTPSSESRLHLAIYRSIPDAAAVVHVHPYQVLALYEGGASLDLGLSPEASFRVSCVAEVPPLQPGTQELADAAAEVLKKGGCNAAVLRRHGIVVYSKVGLYDAVDAVEALSDLASMQLAMRPLRP